jgi:hypothetical protein
MLSFKLNEPPEKIIRDSGINSAAALFAAHQARALMHDYVPMDTGALADRVSISAGGANKAVATVRYNQPYARFCYYGSKKYFSRDKHEKATAYWDTAMILSHRGRLTRTVNDFIKNRTR